MGQDRGFRIQDRTLCTHHFKDFPLSCQRGLLAILDEAHCFISFGQCRDVEATASEQLLGVGVLLQEAQGKKALETLLQQLLDTVDLGPPGCLFIALINLLC